MKEIILCSAIWYKDLPRSITERGFHPVNTDHGIVICGLRHGNCIAILKELAGIRSVKLGPDSVGDYVQGYLTNKNRFVDRKEAYVIASENDQIINDLKPISTKVLYSEDLY